MHRPPRVGNAPDVFPRLDTQRIMCNRQDMKWFSAIGHLSKISPMYPNVFGFLFLILLISCWVVAASLMAENTMGEWQSLFQTSHRCVVSGWMELLPSSDLLVHYSVTQRSTYSLIVFKPVLQSTNDYRIK